jgi:hypothetical protein
MNHKEHAYKDNTDRAILHSLGYPIEFIEWLETNNFQSYDGFERFIRIAPNKRELYSLDHLRQKFESGIKNF